MRTYCLKFADDGLGIAKQVEFEAPDGHRALYIAQKEPFGRRAEVWIDGLRVCAIRCTLDGMWEIEPTGFRPTIAG